MFWISTNPRLKFLSVSVRVSENQNHVRLFVYLTLFIPGFLAGVVPGCFPPTPCNSFVFKVGRVKFCTELLWGRTNILWQEKSGSNR